MRPWRLPLALLLAAITVIIYGLWKLEHMPYRPPHDMSTFLGGPELVLVRGLIRFFAVTWVATLVALLYTLRPPRTAAQPADAADRR